MEQVHQSNFAIVSDNQTTHHPDVDALITTVPDLTLAVKHADCLPILIYHPRGVIAAIHAGRRSTQQQITKKVLKHLRTHFTLSGPLYVWFGPAICTSCHTTNEAKTLNYDLQRENRLQAESIFPQDDLLITVSPQCTVHDTNCFYSYRSEGPGVPMNWSVISLK
jgi:copper oxidase (laccase) domain-containing protein